MVAVVIGLVFAPLASLMVFMITYNEYSHHYSDKKRPLKLAMESALFTLVFFLLLSFFIGFVLSKTFSNSGG